MKVIQIIPNFEIAGAETMCEKLVYELVNLKCEVVVVSLYRTKTEITKRLRENGIKIVYFDKKRGFDFSQILKLYKLFREEKPDVVHTHLYALKYAALASVMAGVPVNVHTIHNIAQKESGKLSRIVNGFYFKSNKVTPVSLTEEIQVTMIDEYNLNNEQTPVIYNGMPLDDYLPKKDYSVKNNINILHVGRFSPQKNHKRLIEAFEIVCRKYPSSKLFLAGVGVLMEEAKLFVNKKGLQENVEFLGLCTDVKTLMHGADIFCLPSDYEGMPMTLIEAMATALPIVATNVGGVSDMIQDGVEGLLCESDAAAVADAIITLIEDELLREKMGKAALLKAQNYSSKSMAEKYLELYASKMKKYRGASK